MVDLCKICKKPINNKEEQEAEVHFECQNRISGDAEDNEG
jgi:hypothetical protein